MNKPLSERLEAEAKLRRGCGQVHIVKLLDDAAALTRRVEEAPVLLATEWIWENVPEELEGQRVALVPVEGGA